MGQSRVMSAQVGNDVGAALDRRVDPVAEAEEYRSMLLGLLGDRDPAEVQTELADQLDAVIEMSGPNLRTRPAPGEWSALEVLGHILDAEITSAARYRWILAQDEPTLIGYDQDRWVERLHSLDDDPQEMLSMLGVLRRSHLQLWAGASETDRARFGVHSERGPESFDLLFRLIAGHGLFHLGQMKRTLAQVAS
jgi:DinB family protein